MKKGNLFALILGCVLCLFGCAAAAQEIHEVRALCAQAHPGYEIAVWEECGHQVAVILKKGEDNILVIAEREDAQSDYAITVDNTNAVYDGDVLPGLLIDTGGDALFYTYHDINGRACEQYHAVKEGERWSRVDVTIFLEEGDLYHSINSCVVDGTLYYQHCDEDENGNILRAWEDAPIAADEGFEESLLLQNFDIDTFDPDPTEGLYPMLRNEAFARSQSVTGETIADMDVSPVHIARLFDRADGTSFLRIDDWDWNGGDYDPNPADDPVLLRFEDGAALDTYHAGPGNVYVSSGVMMYDIEREKARSWYVTGVDDSGVSAIGPDYAAPDGRITVSRNDGYIYGQSPWGCLNNLGGVEVTLAASYEEMVEQLDQSAYALVNNPDPADRLHLRTKADKGAKSLGKFYNRTPVIILERGDTWSHVQIGRGSSCMTGYMMTKYLAFDEGEKAQLACAFPQKQLLEKYHESGVPMYNTPEQSWKPEDIFRYLSDVFRYRSDDFIIGVSGDEWYIVLRADGAVGYVPQRAFWDGNG